MRINSVLLCLQMVQESLSLFMFMLHVKEKEEDSGAAQVITNQRNKTCT